MNNNEKESFALVKRDDFDIFKEFSKKKKKVKITITHQLFTVSILEYVCNFINSKDQTKAQIKFKEICDKLVTFNVIGPHLISDHFRPIRFQYQKLLYTIFNQNTSLYPELTQGRLSIEHNPSTPIISRQSSSNDKENFIFSRYISDFIEYEKIAEGGFGAVYKARNILDENLYAIKKIRLKNYSSAFLNSIWTEVKLFSGLHHENIVNYHNSWIEVDLDAKKLTAPDKNFEIKELESENDSKSKSMKSHSIVFQDEDNCEKSSNDVVSFSNSLNKNRDIVRKKFAESSENDSVSGFFQKPSEISKKSISFSDSDWASSNELKSIRTSYSISKNSKKFLNKDSNFIQSTGENTVILYIQMKLCDFTLAQWLEDRNEKETIDKSVNLDLFRQILSGVDYLHKRSIIHRDIKPGNIFMMKEGIIKIGDFGLACIQSNNTNNNCSFDSSSYSNCLNSDSNAEQHTKGVGTLIYASPEQLKGETYDSSSDMFSLGIILFELFQPFQTKMERYIEIDKAKKLIFSDSLQKNYPNVTDTIRSLLDIDPSKRPNAFSLLLSELFLTKDQIICHLYKLIEKKDLELKEKDGIIAKKELMIQQLLNNS